jgi:hypothetical protein
MFWLMSMILKIHTEINKWIKKKCIKNILLFKCIRYPERERVAENKDIDFLINLN